MESTLSLEQLPDELVAIIAEHLDPADQYLFKQCCRRFYWLLERLGMPGTSEWTSISIFRSTTECPLTATCQMCGEKYHAQVCTRTTTGERNSVPPEFHYYVERKNDITQREEKHSLCKVQQNFEYRNDFEKRLPAEFDLLKCAAITHTTSLVLCEGSYENGKIRNNVPQVFGGVGKYSDRWLTVIRDNALDILPTTMKMLTRYDGLERLTIKNHRKNIFKDFSDKTFADSTLLKTFDVLLHRKDSSRREGVWMEGVTDKSIDIWKQHYDQIRLDMMAVTNCTLDAIIQLIKCILEKKSSLCKFPLHFGFVCVPFSSLSEYTFPFPYKEEVGWFPGFRRDWACRKLSVEDTIHFGIVDTCCSRRLFTPGCCHDVQ